MKSKNFLEFSPECSGLKKIPQTFGSYQFFNQEGEIIYIGKARNLRARINSYWQKSTKHSPAKYAMVDQVKKIEWIETESEIEALLLEANLIKKHQPVFNITLRDDKRYAYLKISTEERWPRIFITRKIEHSGRYFGPFTSVESIRETLKVIRKIWSFRTCRVLPKAPCLYYRIGKCPGCCDEKIMEEDYRKTISAIILFLEGGRQKIVQGLKKEISDCEVKFKKSTGKNREKIEQNLCFLKFRLRNLEKVLEHANILSLGEKYAADVVELAKILNLEKVPKRIEGYDISNTLGNESVGSMVVFEDGEVARSKYRKFRIRDENLEGDVYMLQEVLSRRFARIKKEEENSEQKNIWGVPDLIILDGARQQLNMSMRLLRKFKLDIPIIAISKGGGLRSARARDKIFFPEEKKPLELSLSSPALHIIKRVRDEAHRFAINYHRKLRSRKILGK